MRRGGIAEDAEKGDRLVEMLLDFVAINEKFSDGSHQHLPLFGLLSVEHQRRLLRELLYVIVDSRTEFHCVTSSALARLPLSGELSPSGHCSPRPSPSPLEEVTGGGAGTTGYRGGCRLLMAGRSP